MIFQENLTNLMEGQDVSNKALANLVGVSEEAVRKWRRGLAVPGIDKAMKVAEYFGVSIDELLGKPIIPTEQMVTLPLVGAVNAGSFTIESEDDWQEFRDVSGHALHGRKKSECVLLEVVGESMEPLVHKGEMLVVHRQPYAVNGNIVIAYDADQGGYTVKRFRQNGDTVVLEPANDQYKSYTYTNPSQQQLKIYGICLSAERALI